MNKDLQYQGYSAVPSEYECPDGDLAVAINLIPEDGSLHPITSPGKCNYPFEGSGQCVYIHKSAKYTHLIVCADNKDVDNDNVEFSWHDKADYSEEGSLGIFNRNCKITSVGNTLIFLTSSGLHYFLWKPDDQSYLDLGTHLPECPVSFGLQGEFVGSASFEVTFNDIDFNDSYALFSDSDKATITEQVLAKVNKFVVEQSTDQGKFIFPFFVRYAYRLYDGSLTMHSSPILMMTASDVTPEALVSALHFGQDKKYFDVTLYAIRHTLDYAIVDPRQIYELKKWSDIISSVDIFISAPLYTYDQSGVCERLRHTTALPSDMFGVYKLINQHAPESKYPNRYQKHTLKEAYVLHYQTNSEHNYRVALPRKTKESFKESIRNTANFYLLRSIKPDELKSERTALEIDADYLQSLLTREVMTDDYDSHDTLIATSAFPYNSRLNLAGLSKRLYDSYHPASMFQFTDGFVNPLADYPTAVDGKMSCRIYIHIRQDGHNLVLPGKEAVIGRTAITPSGAGNQIEFLYYPNINAYGATVVMGNGLAIYLPLENHAMLNGAFYFNDITFNYGDSPTFNLADGIPIVCNETVEIPNKIYTSEVNNPFVFPVLGINTVGVGEIKGICSAAKALSEGQFGQFPLYAFTTEGVWALEVSSTGSYSARQPITRDVCINADGITQLDSAVLFPTDRGIMLISGSQTTCISDGINSDFPFNADKLPGFAKMHDMLGHDPNSDTCLPPLSFTEFLKDCRMIYDYVNQRVIIYAPGITYAYIYSLKSKQWGMIYSDIVSHLNSYPEALAVLRGNKIVNFSKPVVDDAVKCLFATRPLKLDSPDVLKTIDTVIQRGNFKKGNVATALYGSRDLVNWHLVWSSKDHYLR